MSAVGRSAAPEARRFPRPAHPVALHGLAAGEGMPPASPDWTVPQHWERYTEAEHATWRRLHERQVRRLQGRACDAFLDGLARLPLQPDRIPDFEALSEVLARRTGWRIVAVPGLVPDEVFFDHLAHRCFPAGQFIRRPEQLDYLEEPDVFHDVFGHVPMLMHPVLADFVQAYGHGGLRAARLGTLPLLARVYWYTVEFGLLRQREGLRLYGAGLASSHAESAFCLDDASPHRLHFALERVMRTRYRIDDFQACYFVLARLEDLLELAEIDFLPLYERVAKLETLAPGTLRPDDGVIHRGTGRRRAAASTRSQP